MFTIKQLLFTERKAMIKNIQKKMGVLSAERNYKPVHLLLMFFIFSVVGWVWEVILGYMTGGMIVNRGVLHSPLLPIYNFSESQ